MLKRRLKEPFGKAGLTVAVLALVMALVGGAYAAGGLTKSQEKQVTKIAKKYAGKPGAPGATGPAGAAGKEGPAGKEGKEGKEGPVGKEGKAGTAGTNGKNVKLINEAPTNCAEGGFTYEVEGSGNKNEVCDGEEGAQGPQGPQGHEGALGTAGTTLPTNATETGVWVAGPNGLAPFMFAPISFTIPLKSPLGASQVHFLLAPEVQKAEAGKFGGGPNELCEGKSGPQLTQCEAEMHTLFTACAGNFETPKASSGNLCVYSNGQLVSGFLSVNKLAGGPGAAVAGALVAIEPPEPGAGIGIGSWAVTG